MTGSLVMLGWLGAGCASTDPDSGRDSGLEESGLPADSDTPDDTDSGTDVDSDGAKAGDDCDDYDPSVYPGAEEVWNGKDDDCDGRSDADGSYGGGFSLDGVAIYEGKPTDVAANCVGTLERIGDWFDFAVECTPAPDDTDSVKLLGNMLSIDEIDNIASDAAWTGSVSITSDDGWESSGDGRLRWTGFDAAALTVTLDAASLSFDLKGTFVWPAPP